MAQEMTQGWRVVTALDCVFAWKQGLEWELTEETAKLVQEAKSDRATGVKEPLTFLQSFLLFRDVRLRRIFLLGVASGFPWLLIGSGMTAWLQEEGLSRSTVGLVGSIFVAYTLNFLWAPLIDQVKLPVLFRLGQRRSWIVLCQTLLIVLTLMLAVTGPGNSFTITVGLAAAIALAGATQDLAIDAYRITVIGKDEPELVGHGAAMATCGWWTGNSLPGVAAFWMADCVGWSWVYVGLAGVLAVITIMVLKTFREPVQYSVGAPRPQPQPRQGALELGRPRQSAQHPWPQAQPRQGGLELILRGTLGYLEAFFEFFRRNGASFALGLLAFIFLFKIGEAFLGRMVIVFYKEVGFSNAEIGTFSKGMGLIVTFVCSVLAGVFAGRFGAVRGLLFAGLAMAATNLLFSWIALAGPRTDLLMLAVVADGITAAFSTVAFVTFLSYFTSRVHTATQYGALASVGNASRTLVAATSGVLVDALGGDWMLFFVITAAMVAPSLCILGWIAARLRALP